MINKRTSIYSILFVCLCLGWLASQLHRLEFDYELENFFPQNDPDLTYYQDFAQTFGHDNDYLLIGFESNTSIFDAKYLNQIDGGLAQVSDLPGTIEIISPTSIRLPVKTPMGLIPIPLIHLNDPDKLHKDSIKLSEHPLFGEMFISKSRKSMKSIIVHQRFENKETADRYVADIKNIFGSFSPRIRLAGKAVAQTAFVNAVKTDFSKFILIAMVLVLGWLILFIRQKVLVIAALCIAGLSVVATIGLMAVTGKKVDVLSSLIPTILLVVAMSDIIHLFTHIQDENAKSKDLKLAVSRAVKQVGLATLLTSFTTAVGFLTLTTINVNPIIDLGIYAALGIVIAFAITYMLFPTLIILIKPNIDAQKQSKVLASLPAKIYHVVNKKSRAILLSSLVLFLLCLGGVAQLEVDAYLVNDLPKNDTVKTDFLFFDQQFTGSKPFTISLWFKNPSLPIFSKEVIMEIDKIEQEIRTQTGAGDLSSPVSIVKLANQSLHGASQAHYRLPETDKQWNRTFRFIRKYHVDQSAIKVNTKSLAQIAGYFEDLGSKDATLKHKNLIAVLDEKVNHNILGYRLTGTTLLIDKSHEMLSANLIKGLALAMCIVAVITGLLFKSWRMIVITLIPNTFPILAVAAIMGYFQIPLNLSTSVIFAISFGIVVDDTIHFLSQFKHEYGNGQSKHEAIKKSLSNTGRPIIITTVVLTSGFLVFCLSGFSATFYMGLFVSISFITALLADLYLLPVLLLWWLPNKTKS